MNQLQQKGLRALLLLDEREWTLDQLSDKLCVCKRYAQKVIKHLKDSGFTVNCKTKNRTRYFWTTPDKIFVSAVLSPSEQLAINEALVSPNIPLQTAVYKLTQMTNIQLFINHQ